MSYVVLGGRCRACGVVIPWRYPLVEALAVALGLLVLWHLGPTWAALRAFVLCLALVACAFTDLETRRIPDRITLPGVMGACILGPEGLGRGSVGAVIGALVFALFAMAPRPWRPATRRRRRGRSRSGGAAAARRLLGGGVGGGGRAGSSRSCTSRR